MNWQRIYYCKGCDAWSSWHWSTLKPCPDCGRDVMPEDRVGRLVYHTIWDWLFRRADVVYKDES